MRRAEATRDLVAAPPASLLRAMGHETRLRALVLMGVEGELCVCELNHALAVSQPKMSRHLAVLRESGLVADRRERIWIHYRIDQNNPLWVREALDAVVRGNAGSSPFREDRERLARMPDRPGGRCAPPAQVVRRQERET